MSAQTSYNPDQENWNNLAAAAQAGDKKAYHALLKILATYIPNYLTSSLANPEWAQDVTQDSLISIHKALKTYDPAKPFKPWMLAIVNFRKADFLRKYYRKKRDQHTSLENPDFIKEHVTTPKHSGEYKDIEAALDSLPDNQRIVFEMVKIQGFSIKEVAQKMDMTESAVKVSAHRTMHKLREKLG